MPRFPPGPTHGDASSLQNLSLGKEANGLGRLDVPHTFIYTEDPPASGIPKAPTARPGTSLRPVIRPTAGRGKMAGGAFGVEPRVRVAGKFLTRLMGLFMPIMRELSGMLYRYDRSYVFDSSQLEKRFDVRPIPYEEGLRTGCQEIKMESPMAVREGEPLKSLPIRFCHYWASVRHRLAGCPDVRGFF